jgi:hypothetical protein
LCLNKTSCSKIERCAWHLVSDLFCSFSSHQK